MEGVVRGREPCHSFRIALLTLSRRDGWHLIISFTLLSSLSVSLRSSSRRTLFFFFFEEEATEMGEVGLLI